MIIQVIVIIRIVSSGFTEHISDVLDEVQHAVFIIIVSRHAVLTLHTIDLILRTRNVKVPDADVNLKCQQVNMHHLTFSPASSTVRVWQGTRQQLGRLSYKEGGFGDTRRKDCGLQPECSKLHLLSSHFTCMLELIFHIVMKYANITHLHLVRSVYSPLHTLCY